MEPTIITRKNRFFYKTKLDKKGSLIIEDNPLRVNNLHHFGSDLVSIVVNESDSKVVRRSKEFEIVLDHLKSAGSDCAYIGDGCLNSKLIGKGQLGYQKIISLYDQNFA